MGSSVTGIPAAGVTGVLPVAVTGGSGLTALGTVTAGTYNATIGSSATFPAGSILQIQRSSYQTSNDNSSDVNWDTSGTLTITPKSASSSLWMQFHCIAYTEGVQYNQLTIGINTASDGSGTDVSWTADTKNVEKKTSAQSEIGEVTVPGYVSSTGSISARSYYLIWRPSTNGENCNLSTSNGLIIEYLPYSP